MKLDQIAELLPDIFQRAVETPLTGMESTSTAGETPLTLLKIFLALMEWFHHDIEVTLANFSEYLDPDHAPDAFIPFLAHWVNLGDLWEDGLDSLDDQERTARMRNLILKAVHLAHWRGTGMGLLAFLETATGQKGYQVVDSYEKPFHVIVTYPATAEPYLKLIQKIVVREKPAYVTYELRRSDMNGEKI